MELTGKRVVITGASRGIGAEMAKVFASAGSQVVVSARTESAITKLADEIDGIAVPLDANDPENVRTYIDRVESIAGPIDVLSIMLVLKKALLLKILPSTKLKKH